MDSTNEFSFILKPSPKHGIGIFATHDIKNGVWLRLFGDHGKEGDMVRNKKDVPEIFWGYCIDMGNTLMCAKDFSCLHAGWYMNHSRTANAVHRNFDWYAARDIKAGEEILADYNTLGEPKESVEDYYKQ